MSLKIYTGMKFLAVIEGKVAKSFELLLGEIRAQLTQGVEKKKSG